MTGRGLPLSPLAAPLVAIFTAARWTFHNDMGAPQAGQKEEAANKGLPQRGQEPAVRASAGGGGADAAAGPLATARVLTYRRTKKHVSSITAANVISVSIMVSPLSRS